MSIAAVPLAALVLLSGGLSGKRNETVPPAPGTGNHPPFVKTASILPSPLVLSGPITVRVEAQDIDQQTMVFRYRWLVNGDVMSGQTQSALKPQLLKRGDQVAVEVIPFDGAVEGTPFRTLPVTVANTAPIISDVSVDFDHDVQGRRLLAKVDVADPDHDPAPLAYRWRKNDTVLKEGEDNTLDLANFTARRRRSGGGHGIGWQWNHKPLGAIQHVKLFSDHSLQPFCIGGWKYLRISSPSQ